MQKHYLALNTVDSWLKFDKRPWFFSRLDLIPKASRMLFIKALGQKNWGKLETFKSSVF